MACNTIQMVSDDSELACPICFELMDKAHTTRCGHSYCQACINQTIQVTKCCPLCQTPCSVDDIFPSFALNKIIENYKMNTLQQRSNTTSVTQNSRNTINNLSFNVQNTDHFLLNLASDSEENSCLKKLEKLCKEYVTQGKSELAIPMCYQALEDLENKYGHNDLKITNVLQILVYINYQQNRIEDAFNIANEALSIQENLLGKNHPNSSNILGWLAELFYKQNKYIEAECFGRRALETQFDDRRIASMSNNLGVYCVKNGKFAEAEQLHKKALYIYTMMSDHAKIIKTNNFLAKLESFSDEAPTIGYQNGNSRPNQLIFCSCRTTCRSCKCATNKVKCNDKCHSSAMFNNANCLNK